MPPLHAVLQLLLFNLDLKLPRTWRSKQPRRPRPGSAYDNAALRCYSS